MCKTKVTNSLVLKFEFKTELKFGFKRKSFLTIRFLL